MFINLVVKKVHSVDEFGREKTFTLFNSCVFSSVAFFPRTEKERRKKRPQTCCEKIREQSFLIAKKNIA